FILHEVFGGFVNGGSAGVASLSDPSRRRWRTYAGALRRAGAPWTLRPRRPWNVRRIGGVASGTSGTKNSPGCVQVSLALSFTGGPLCCLGLRSPEVFHHVVPEPPHCGCLPNPFDSHSHRVVGRLLGGSTMVAMLTVLALIVGTAADGAVLCAKPRK